MATSQTSEFIQHLRRIILPRNGAGLTDAQMLEDYLSRCDEAALAALVRRHGPMVWGVCRRVLPNYHDAEDAFQATFLVLVRKAASIASRELLANWLYGVAHQTALNARAMAARRKGRERQVAEMPEPAVAERELCPDLQPLLDEELSRLPDKYRAVIVLCDLEGKARTEAARQLSVPEGTVAGWLARARAALAKRLNQRGVAVPGGGALAAALAQLASAGVPTSVASSTIKVAILSAAGQAAAASGAISAPVTDLTEGVLRAMSLTKLKAVSAVVLLVVAILGGAAGVLCRTQAAAEQPMAPAASAQPADKEKQPAVEPAAKTDLDRLQGVWKLEYVEVNGKPQKMEHYKKTRFVIKGDKLTLGSNDGHDDTGWVRVHSTKQPKEIDMVTIHRGGDLLTSPGIYKLHGDRLTICYAPHLDAGQLRPTEFETAKEGGRLWVLVRAPQP